MSKYLRPLTKEGGAADALKNDAAVYSPNPGMDIVTTKDTSIAGVHFFENDDPELIAERCLRINLSDLAAMGAEPVGYLLSLSLPITGIDVDSWVKKFATGLSSNQKFFRWDLWGGDTVSTPGPLSVSVTAIGEVKRGQYLSRSGANVGDGIYVSGALGDAAMALDVIQGNLNTDKDAFFKKRFYKPFPRLKLGKNLVGVASAALDISDGLMGDISHICNHSGVGAIIYCDKIPLSSAFVNILNENKQYHSLSWSGGDDYELLFTVPKENEKQLQNLPKCQYHDIVKIGEIIEGDNAILLDGIGNKIELEKQGFQHF
ncbi:thiamine-phosphate kinase [Pseudemcibacter aquimaris]|uniref:thiamine-phosphate kinase n=1 Tax=Pseudemcibacter aquimaris TaxID=2857064 RepID=UPI00237DB108|nr:thiamine-phosphate kinase [Pseudemcibacter aquimaris]MCC3860608.1 thiamine-phosphate kinase [Pseudemcibacter aquimaris]